MRFTREHLRRLRNDIPIEDVIVELDLTRKHRDGYLRFLCPHCQDFHTAVHPRENLARCFRCRVNFNPIDLVMTVSKATFREAVEALTRRLRVGGRGRNDAVSNHQLL